MRPTSSKAVRAFTEQARKRGASFSRVGLSRVARYSLRMMYLPPVGDSMAAFAIAALTLAIWIYVMVARGWFWRTAEREDGAAPAPPHWPDVVAVIPARDEAEVIARNLTWVLTEHYVGSFTVVLIDDQSRDGTAAMAGRAAATVGATGRLTIVNGRTPPAGWGGKVWAMKQGVERVESAAEAPRYLLFTDADIAYDPGTLRHLVARAEAGDLVLTSYMVKLRCESLVERLFVPAFVYFFRMLYPFAWVNRPGGTAAAAGGCMLVRFDALRAAGGIEAICGALIDDCALGRAMKMVGPIWLGLTDRVHSLRAYPGVGDVRRMVARTAYDQLNYSALLLAATVAAMTLVYLVPPVLAVLGSWPTRAVAATAWVLMLLSFQPMLRFYR